MPGYITTHSNSRVDIVDVLLVTLVYFDVVLNHYTSIHMDTIASCGYTD